MSADFTLPGPKDLLPFPASSSPFGSLIRQAQDSYGDIKVFEQAGVRVLCFEDQIEQSASLSARPELLLFEYTQVMLLSLLFVQPDRILQLGLGAGSLVTALYHACPTSELTAVELRERVIDLAYSCFRLPRSPRLRVHCKDAGSFISESTGPYELIFSDLYTGQGMAPLQLQADFLAACAARLAPGGLLVINSWLEDGLSQLWHERLGSFFPDLRMCPTGDGNCVIFAATRPLPKDLSRLKPLASHWSNRFGFSLSRHLQRLQPL